MSWHEERESLLKSPINKLDLKIEGSALEPLIKELYAELDRAGLEFKPPVYLSDEWGCPEGVPVIAVPFYLADPKLSQIENEERENLETPEESMMYFRHEAGHAFNYAYRLYEDEEWHRVFGPYSRPYIEDYRPNAFSRDFVRHIAGWYAQKHPDEDFAETFAVWLDPDSSWRDAYQGSGALAKLQYVDSIARTIGALPPKVKPSTFDLPVQEMSYTVGDYYLNEKRPPVEVPLWFDGDLKQLFESKASDRTESAASMLRANRLSIINEVAYWTGVEWSVIRSLVDHLSGRAESLGLQVVRGDDSQYLVSFVAMVTTLAINFLHHASFIPSEKK